MLDIQKVLFACDKETQDFLFTIIDTLARVSEIRNLTWDDVNLDRNQIILKTRKKRDSILTPRQIYMTDRLRHIQQERYNNRDESVPWVFSHRKWSKKQNRFIVRPYTHRGKLMKRLCKLAGVKYFSFHSLRHFGASMLAKKHVPLPDIQNVLGHEKLTTTSGYIQSLGEGGKEAMLVFESHTQFHTQMENGASQELEKLANPV